MDEIEEREFNLRSLVPIMLKGKKSETSACIRLHYIGMQDGIGVDKL